MVKPQWFHCSLFRFNACVLRTEDVNEGGQGSEAWTGSRYLNRGGKLAMSLAKSPDNHYCASQQHSWQINTDSGFTWIALHSKAAISAPDRTECQACGPPNGSLQSTSSLGQTEAWRRGHLCCQPAWSRVSRTVAAEALDFFLGVICISMGKQECFWHDS